MGPVLMRRVDGRLALGRLTRKRVHRHDRLLNRRRRRRRRRLEKLLRRDRRLPLLFNGHNFRRGHSLRSSISCLLLLLKMWWLLLLWCGLLLLLLRILMDLRMLLQIWTSLFWRNADVSRRRCQVEFVSEILEIGKLFAPVSDPTSVLRGRALLLL